MSTINKIFKADCPEDIFGAIKTIHDLKRVYRLLAKEFHPDKNKSNQACAAFAKLGVWRDKAESAISRGVYGKREMDVKFSILGKLCNYHAKRIIAEGSISTVYEAEVEGGPWHGKPVALKVCRDIKNNDLMMAESKNLSEMRKGFVAKYGDSFTELSRFPDILSNIASMTSKGSIRGHQVNATPLLRNMISLDDVLRFYPNGVEPQAAAWMFNRVLESLCVAHTQGYVHGAVLCRHMMVDVKTHAGCMVGWTYSVKSGEKLSAIEKGTYAFYPSDDFAATIMLRYTPAAPELDVYTASHILEALCEKPMPEQFKNFIRACRLSSGRRFQNSMVAYGAFSNILTSLFGERKFVEFKLPV